MADRSDGLAVFTILFAHSLALQVAKQIHVIRPTITKMFQATTELNYSSSYSTQFTQLIGYAFSTPVKDVSNDLASSALPLLLFIAISCCHFRPNSNAVLLSLAISGISVLLVHGSQSNHVLLEALVAISILLTFPWVDALFCAHDHTTYFYLRNLWSAQLAASMRALLCTLYLVTALAKLNSDFFDTNSSCCVLMATGAFGSLMPSSPVALALLPVSAVALEVLLPLAIVIGSRIEHSHPATASLILRGCVLVGGVFHVVIALPPPPMSVYPFSMLMAPMYVMLIPAETGAALRALLGRPASVHAAIIAAAAAAAAATHMLSGTDRFEYPPYLSYEFGICWIVFAFGGLAVVALANVIPARTDKHANMHTRARATDAADAVGSFGLPTTRVRFAMLLPAIALGIVGALPYLGVRTHVAFAMFSNLRIEGGQSNHFLVKRTLLDALGSGALRSVEVLETDLPSLRSAQVDLFPLLPAATRSAVVGLNLTSEFYIAPPNAWPTALPAPFRPFMLPLIEVRRRVAKAASALPDFYFRYRYPEDGADGEREYRHARGLRTAESDPALAEPLSFLQAVFHRYRPFHTAYSPCRH